MTDVKSRLPTHRIYAVVRKDGAAKDEKSFWQQVGAAWAHADGKGMSLKLEYLPLGDAELVIRACTEREPADAPVVGS